MIDSDRGRRVGRYGTSTAGIGVLGLVGFIVLVRVGDVSEVGASMTVSLVGVPPSYVVNKRWVWRARGRDHLILEILPFVGFALLGWILGALAVVMSTQVVPDPPLVRLAAAIAANILALAGVTVARFVVLERVTFATATRV